MLFLFSIISLVVTICIVIHRQQQQDYGLDVIDHSGEHTGFEDYYIVHNLDVIFFEPVTEERLVDDISNFQTFY